MPSLFEREQPVAGYARVIVERGIDRYPDGLTYAVPEKLADLRAGERVRVPLGRGDALTPGYVVARQNEPDAGVDPAKLKAVHERDRSAARITDDLLELARWIAGYYCTPLGMVLGAMLPGAVKKNIGMVVRKVIDLAENVPADAPKPTKKQQQVLEVLRELPEGLRPIEARDLAERAGLGTVGPINRLVEAGHLVESTRTNIEAAWACQAVDRFIPPSLTDEQRMVFDAITARLDDGFSAHLIHGVTGSGKTEVYIRLIERVVAAGRVALVLVPEIALTPQTGGRLIGRFPDHRVAVLHSGLTAAQRHQQWSLVANGHAEVILGARSAVFAPVVESRLGLIIVDEEHEGSYKQDQLPRYHGRDVAIRRAQLTKCPIVLGSATPSLESWHNATERNTFTLHRMRSRVPGATLPKVTIVDFREQMRERRDKRVHLIGPLLEHHFIKTLESGYQALILLNRRGYANYIACPDLNCGWVMQCDQCDATMVYHRHGTLPTGGFVKCHHCLSEQKLPVTCPTCSKRIVTFGLGTQRVEEELLRAYPDLVENATLLRMDSDTMHSAHQYHEALGRFARGEVRVLLGTQMIAKGLDFPRVRLVGVINADTSINLPDFRAAERTFQLVSQVAGRTGRADSAGRVVVQSFHPEAPAIRLAAKHDYEGFANEELRIRANLGLPPVTRMARIVLRDEDLPTVVGDATSLAERLRALAGPDIRLKGPAPCPISRIAGHHRQQIELIAATPGELQRLLTAARNEGLVKSDARMAVDVDPIALL